MQKGSFALSLVVAVIVFVYIPASKHASQLQRDEEADQQSNLNRYASAQRRVNGGSEPRDTASLQDDERAPVHITNTETVAPSTAPRPAPNSSGIADRVYGVGCYRGSAKAWRPGKCADDNAWLIPWMATRPGTDWTLVDVGANKGYVIAGWLETLLGPHRTPFTPHNLGVSIYTNNDIQQGFLNMCGGCTECLDPPARMNEANRARSVKVYGFEPSIANYRWLKFFFNDTSVVNITNAAVSHTPGTAYFPVEALGKETGKVSPVAAPGFQPVQIVSLDAFLSNDLAFIDVLSTDAEGFDQDVAKGALGFIQNGRVGVYQFEMYRKEDYKSIFERLYEWGYVCYYFTEVRKGYTAPWLIRISGCWQEYFQQLIGWVNGLCYNTRVPALAPIFERLQRRIHRNGGPTRLVARRGVMNFVQRFVHKPARNESVAR